MVAINEEIAGMRVVSYSLHRCENGKSYRRYLLKCPNCDWEYETTQIGNFRKRKVGCEQCRPKTSLNIVERNFYAKIKYTAKHRQIHFDLTFEEFLSVLSNSCHYCSGPGVPRFNLDRTQQETYCGLDRVNSSLGYTYTNVVPCCYPCNRAKSDMGYINFVEWADRLANYRQEIR